MPEGIAMNRADLLAFWNLLPSRVRAALAALTVAVLVAGTFLAGWLGALATR